MLDDRMANPEGLGGRFWLGLIGALIAILIGLFLAFVVFERAVYRWGALGAFLVVGGAALLVVWVLDRREIRKAEQDLRA